MNFYGFSEDSTKKNPNDFQMEMMKNQAVKHGRTLKDQLEKSQKNQLTSQKS